MRAGVVGFAKWFVVAVLLTSCATAPVQHDQARQSGPEQRHSIGARGAEHAGEHIYEVSCAACHGADAKGNGPVAPLLRVEVPDLTRIQARRGGQFPEREVFRIIDGQSDLAAHGSRHMPVWGYEFFGTDASDDEEAHQQATRKVDRLVAYLRSIQR